MTVMADRLMRKSSWQVLRKKGAKRKEGTKCRGGQRNQEMTLREDWNTTDTEHGGKQEKNKTRKQGRESSRSCWGPEKKGKPRTAGTGMGRYRHGDLGRGIHREGGAGELNLIQNAPHRGQTTGRTASRGDK